MREFRLDVAERTRLHGPDAPASLLPRTDAQRRFDAMVSIFRRSVAVAPGAKPPAPVVNIAIELGRKRRLFTGSAREAVLLMATRCDFLGCDVPGAHTQIDHLDEWERDGGSTDPVNAGLGCGGHNRAKHRKYTAKRHRNGTVV